MKRILKGSFLYVMIYFVFLSDFTLSYENKSVYSVHYNGVVWVALDAYSIWKYNSSDKIMNVIEFQKSTLK